MQRGCPRGLQERDMACFIINYMPAACLPRKLLQGQLEDRLCMIGGLMTFHCME